MVERECVVVDAGIGLTEEAADDGAYGLLDVAGSPEEVGAAIAEALRHDDLLRGGRSAALADRGESIYLTVTVRISPKR